MSRNIFLALAITVTASGAGADDDKKAGGDQTQSLDSPLPLVGGINLTASKDKTSVSLAINQTLANGLYWQAGASGTANEGDAPAFSHSGGFAPGFKGKVGFGYSSFLADDSSERRAQIDLFMTEAWCYDTVQAAAGVMGEKIIKLSDPKVVASCKPLFDALPGAVATFRSGPGGEEAAKPIEAAITQLDSVIKAGFKHEARTAACKALAEIAWAKKACSNPDDVTTRSEAYPALYARVVTIPTHKSRLKISANWTPSITGAKYRPVTDGVPDLSNEQKWAGFLNGGSIDATYHLRAFIAGLQFAYADTLDEDELKEVDICQRTTQGDFYSDSCKKGVIGKPQPFASASVGAVLQIDPLMPSFGSSAFRPGVQLAAKWERLQAGKRRYTVTVPIYLARVDSPLDFVVGIRPSYEWDRGSKRSENFAVSVFVGARP